jgi:hypothetical protein
VEPFTAEELTLIRDEAFFRAKTQITRKIRTLLEMVHAVFKEELKGADLLAPDGFDLAICQYVKGEHLEDYPYQYLDFPKHFAGGDKFTLRTLFWWGHHFVFALMLEGKGLLQYKQNLLSRYQTVVTGQLSLSLGSSLWEWRRGEGYTLELTSERRSEVAAVLSGRPFFKLSRFLPLDDPAVKQGRVVEVARQTIQAVLPVISR